MGEQTPPSRRMASNQKCVRTLDIEEVGKTTRHGTFFQMLGNFSFGDYFKEEAIHYAYDLLTSPREDGGFGFDPEKLWMTTYTDDDEARAMWRNEGVDPEHIQILGMEDNFWTTGGPGPGGPCSEIYVGHRHRIRQGRRPHRRRKPVYRDLGPRVRELHGGQRQVENRPAHRR